MYYIEKRQAGGILDSVLLVTSLLPHTALNSTCVWRGTIFSCLSCNSCLFLVSLRVNTHAHVVCHLLSLRVDTPGYAYWKHAHTPRLPNFVSLSWFQY